MANMLSPGVYIEEIDASHIAPNVSANVAFLAGDFNRGPQAQPTVITNKNEYEAVFGTPTDRNYNSWYQGYKFFDYADKLIVSRGVNSRLKSLTSMDQKTPKRFIGEYDKMNIGQDIFEVVDLFDAAGSVQEVTTNKPNGQSFVIEIYRNDSILPDFREGTVSLFGTLNIEGKVEKAYMINQDDPSKPVNPGEPLPIDPNAYTYAKSFYQVSVGQQQDVEKLTTEYNVGVKGKKVIASEGTVNFDYRTNDVTDVLSPGDYIMVGTDGKQTDVFEVYSSVTTESYSGGAMELNVSAIKTIDPANVDTSIPKTGSIYLLAEHHRNAVVEAFGTNLDQTDPNNRLDTNSSDWNMDINLAQLWNNKRTNYRYDLIKNSEDFDIKMENGLLNTFQRSAKLKFYARNSSEDQLEIAIANTWDFEEINSDTHENFTVAFKSGTGTSTEYTYLTSLYDYYPAKDQVGIMIKSPTGIETYIVSFDRTAVDGNGKSLYVENVINENSKVVYVVDNPSVDGVASYLAHGIMGPAEGSTTVNTLKLRGGRNPELNKGSLTDAYMMVTDKEKYEIDVVIGNEEYPNIGTDLALKRKDCIAFNGARYIDCVGKTAIEATNAIVKTIKTGYRDGSDANATLVKITRTMFSAYFGNYFKIYDKYALKSRWINVAGDMAGIRCQVTSDSAPWWVSAGVSRGGVRNINKMAFTPSLEMRDLLYKNGINPIVSFPGTGYRVWGNKTLQPTASSFDRINVRTLFNTLERSMAKAARSQVFEFNDVYTRNSILSMFNPYLATVKAGRGIVDYLVVCDETNNTPDVISRNELHVDIYIKPNYAAEMILLTFTNVGTRSFADVIGA